MEMEANSNHPLQEQGSNKNDVVSDKDSRKPKGGLITMPFIIANESFEKVASFGLLPNMIFYLMNEYKMGFARATNLLFYWSAATNFMPLLGAFVADSYLGRFLAIGLGSIASLLGMLQLWLTAMIPRTRPPPCDQLAQRCKLATPSQLTLLISSFGLMSIGAGGVRPCSMAFGADQLVRRGGAGGELRDDERVLERYFNWYYASASLSVLIAITAIVYVQEHKGWKVGFGVPLVLMFLSALMFFVASSLYVKPKASRSLLTGFFQVVVAAVKNRRLGYPGNETDKEAYYREKGSEYTCPTKKLRFLNKACMIKSPHHRKSRWDLCTVEQVEELKALIKIIPMWSTGIMTAINLSQSSFPALQANSMDRHITSGFKIPAGSIGMFNIVTLALWVVLYDRAILPLASKIARRKVHLGVKTRMGIGIFLSLSAMIASGLVEHVRRKRALEQGLGGNTRGLVHMSALWLVPQNCLLGLSEAFNAIGQTEFYYTELPKSMSSVAASLFGVGMAIANLLASVILNGVDRLSKRGGKESWVSSNINGGHYEYYYWILAALTFLDLLYFVVCSWAYGPCASRESSVGDGDVELVEEEKLSVS